mgnify:CR=1 FL=1
MQQNSTSPAGSCTWYNAPAGRAMAPEAGCPVWGREAQGHTCMGGGQRCKADRKSGAMKGSDGRETAQVHDGWRGGGGCRLGSAWGMVQDE